MMICFLKSLCLIYGELIKDDREFIWGGWGKVGDKNEEGWGEEEGIQEVRFIYKVTWLS